MSSTRFPRRASAAATLIAVVVLPTPPFWFTTLIRLAIEPPLRNWLRAEPPKANAAAQPATGAPGRGPPDVVPHAAHAATRCWSGCRPGFPPRKQYADSRASCQRQCDAVRTVLHKMERACAVGPGRRTDGRRGQRRDLC